MPAVSSAETAARIAASDGSARPMAVTRVTSPRRERVTPVTSPLSAQGTTSVPTLPSSHERTSTVTPCLAASATERSWSTCAPFAARRSIWSQETAASRRAVGHTRGSVV